MCGLTKHKVKMDRDSDATEIEDESLHLYFSGEDSPSLLSGTPKGTQNGEKNVCTLRRSPRKTVKNVNTQKRQLSSSESGDSNDNTEVQKPEQRQKKAGNKVQSEDRLLRKMQKKSSRQLISTESDHEDSDSLLRRSTFQTQKKKSFTPRVEIRRSPRKSVREAASPTANASFQELSSSESGDTEDSFHLKRPHSTKKKTPEDGQTPKASQKSKEKNKTPGTFSRNQPASVSAVRTPINGSGSVLKTQIQQILANQNEIIQQLNTVKKDVKEIKGEMEKRKLETNEPIQVPNRIRSAVKDAFLNGQQSNNLSWNCSKRFMDEENLELTDFIKKSVQGIAPEEKIEVINAAIKRYFTSQKEAENRQKKNKTEIHKKRQATYERKKEKLKRRKVMIEKKSGWSKEKKTKVHQFLQLPEAHKYMSSDEEVDNGFLSHPYSWESEDWRKIKDSLDKKFLETCPPRSKRLLAKRTRGSVKNQEPPNVDPTHSWVLNED